jgi:ABC-2 type transport system ATP-binding protein
MRELLRELKLMGKTIFFSSHILSEVADICTSIAILEAGSLVAYGDMAEMKRQLRTHRLIQIRLLDELTPVQEFLLRHEAVESIITSEEVDIPSDALRFDFTGDDESLSSLLASLIANNFRVVAFQEETGDLEDVFLQVTKGIVN